MAVQPDADATAELADRAAKGELTLRVAETLPLERFRDAYTRLEGAAVYADCLLQWHDLSPAARGGQAT